MSYSYLSSGPGSSDRSWVRMRIGDNSSADVLLQDEEIDVLLDDYGSKWSAAAAAARSVGAGFARRTEKTVGKLKIVMGESSAHYFDLASLLDAEANTNAGGAFAGGISDADKKTQTDDTDWAGASFTRSQFDNPSGPTNSRAS